MIQRLLPNTTLATCLLVGLGLGLGASLTPRAAAQVSDAPPISPPISPYDVLDPVFTAGPMARLPVRIVAGRLVVTCDVSTTERRLPANLFLDFESPSTLELHNQAANGLKAERQDGSTIPITVHLPGLEFAVGIPGSVGGALNSNAGTGDGRSIGPLVESVEVLGGRGRRTLPASELRFEYRRSSLRGAGVMVLGATLRLRPAPTAEIEAEMARLLTHRQATQPTAEPNAGSIFRNPEGDAAGRLIEAAGCKRLAFGPAHVSELHANFIVHDGSARAADIVALIAELQRRVLAHAHIRLQPEIEWWGDGELPPPFAEPAPVEDLGGRAVF